MRCSSLLAVLVLLSASQVSSQESQTTDLVAQFDAERGPVAGDWTMTADGLRVTASKLARTRLAADAPDNYDLLVEFTRERGDDTVAVILPVGDVSPALELSAWTGQAHGLSRVDGLACRDEKNPASARPGALENGKRHRLDARVRTTGQEASVAAALDGKVLFQWSGPVSRLQQNLAVNLPAPRTFGLAAHQSDVVFHRVLLREAETATPETNEPASVTKVLLGREDAPSLEVYNNATFEVASEDGKTFVRSRPEVGRLDRVGYLEGVEFSEGVIEIDLRGALPRQGSFVGVAFHGVDGETYDAVYFRPFNFGSPDESSRGHAVQYISHPDWPWNRLRAERTGQFEKAVTPEPKGDAWFHARIEVEKRRVRVFVEESDDPSLDVELLSDRDGGKVGLWFNGVAAYANLKITNR